MIGETVPRYFICITIIFVLFLSACVTKLSDPISLEEALSSNVAISVPIRFTEKGVIVIKGVKVQNQSLDMVLDTGATQSAIFETALQRLNIETVSDNSTMVHGMLESAERHVLTLTQLEIGPVLLLNKPIVVLDDRNSDFVNVETYDGLIGMDVLSDYQLYVSTETRELRFIPKENVISVPASWARIDIVPNPFQLDNRSLNFIYARIAGRNTPALLDTGAEFSAMNWPAASYSQARPIRKQLREKWELQGAVGTFEPIAKLRLERFRGGQMFWTNKEFIVMDLESLDVLGVEEKPFMIAGMNLFNEETFFIDFERGFIAIKPK